MTVGKSCVQAMVFCGMGSVDPLAEIDLEVDATADLNVDQLTDLAVKRAVIWTGATSVRLIAYEGEGAKTLAAINL
jgi:hypothetical protein